MRAPRPAVARPFLVAALVLLVSTVPAPVLDADAPPERAQPLRLEGDAFGASAVIRVRGVGEDEGKTAVRAAFERMTEVEEMVEAAVEAFNAEPGRHREIRPPTSADGLFDLLERSLSFCRWSEGAHGPLGGNFQAHWEAAAGNPEPPPPPPGAAQSAACDRMALDREKGVVQIAAGSRVALDGFARGFAVDAAVEALRAAGIEDALVRLGRIHRAIGDGGDGPEGSGWPVLLPVFEGYRQPLDEVNLRESSMALIWRADWPSNRPLFVDQRSGKPPGTPWATVAVTELAVDAQALAVSAMVLGSREGRFRMAGLEPEPAVLWLLGRGKGRPLMLDLNWSSLRTP